MPDVLAIADERIVQVGPPVNPFVSVTGVCPLGSDVQYDSTTETYSASGGWYQSYPQGQLPKAITASSDSANIMAAPSGEVACLYGLLGGPPSFSPLGQLILKNKIYQNAVGSGSNWLSGHSQLWPGPPYPSSYCNTLTDTACAFSTVAPN
jgi:hypothetical protein